MAHKFETRDDVRLFLNWVAGKYGKEISYQVNRYYTDLSAQYGERKAIAYIAQIIETENFNALPVYS